MNTLCLLLVAIGVLMAKMPLGLNNSGVPESVNSVLVDYFTTAATKLARVVVDPPGTTPTAQAYRRARAADQLSQVRRILRSLDQSVQSWTGEAITTAYRAGRKLGIEQARTAGVRTGNIDGSFSQVSQRSAAIFAADTYSRLKAAADGMGERVVGVLRKTADVGLSRADLNSILAGGVITGQPRQTIRQLRDELRKIHGGEVEIVGKDGVARNYGVGYYAEMVARTQTREATVKARHQQLAELDIDLVMVVGRVSDNFCSAYLGMVFSLSGNSDTYPSIDEIDGPPFHPNCSKSTRPFIPELASRQQLEAAEGVDGAEKLLGLKGYAAQRAYQSLQLRSRVQRAYASTADKVFDGGEPPASGESSAGGES